MDEFVQFAVKKWYLFAALAAILGVLIGTEVLRRVRGISNVNPTETLQLLNHEDAVMLDIRDMGEYKEGHIAEARHAPLTTLKTRLGELEKLKSRPIVVYCRTGGRSPGACALLKKNGFEKVYNLSGGLTAWQNANLPLKRKK